MECRLHEYMQSGNSAGFTTERSIASMIGRVALLLHIHCITAIAMPNRSSFHIPISTGLLLLEYCNQFVATTYIKSLCAPVSKDGAPTTQYRILEAIYPVFQSLNS